MHDITQIQSLACTIQQPVNMHLVETTKTKSCNKRERKNHLSLLMSMLFFFFFFLTTINANKKGTQCVSNVSAQPIIIICKPKQMDTE